MKYFSMDGREFYCSGRLLRICGPRAHWYETVDDPNAAVAALRRLPQRLHIFTFFERRPYTVTKYSYHMEPYSLAVIALTNYGDWWDNCIKKTTRHGIRRAKKSGLEVRVVEFDDELVRGISSIYDETPIRQGRRFPHYKDSLQRVRNENGTFSDRSVFLGAYHREELVGFMRIVFLDDGFADILQFLSRISDLDKRPNNALMAKAVELCGARGARYLAYGELGSDGLGDFKRNNGFSRMDLPRYYIPLNSVGAVALRLKLHRRPSDVMPERFTCRLKGLRRRWYAVRARYGGDSFLHLMDEDVSRLKEADG